MATTATPWCGSNDSKLYLQSGQFTSTVKTSEDVSGVDTVPVGITWDGTNTPWAGWTDDKLYLQSGQFTSTIKDSQSVNTIDLNPDGISYDGINTPWIGWEDDKLYLQSGQFSSTLKTSEYVNAIDGVPRGISWDGTNTPWCGGNTDKLFLQSGQFSSTLKTSQSVSAVESDLSDMSWDGTNTPWTGHNDDKLYLQSGQFTSTLKTSQLVTSIDNGPQGICTDDFINRVTAIQDMVDTLTFSEQVNETIIRVPLDVQPISDTLVFTEDAGYTSGVLEPLDTLTFVEVVTVFNNNLRVADVLVFVEIARQPTINTLSISDTIVFVESAALTTNRYDLSDTLTFTEFADLRGSEYRIERSGTDTLTFSDEVSVDLNFYAFHIDETLTLTDSITVINPYNRNMTDTLDFDETLTIRQPHNVGAITYFNWTYGPDGHPFAMRPSFMEAVDLELVLSRRAYDNLTFIESVGIVKEIVGAVSKSVSDTLIFTEEAARVYGGISTLTFTETADVDLCKPGKDTLTFTESVIYSHKASYSLSDTLILESTVAYDLITSDIFCAYSPFIGDSTAADAPRPPHQTPPTIVTYNNIQLYWPVDNPTNTITLRGPEFDDRDQLHFARISRETRGGTLIVFADPMWPQNQRLLLNFVGLSEVDAQAALSFVETTVAKQIGLRDWEGREWVGVILTPDNPVTRNHNCNIGFDIEFEGVILHRPEVAPDILTLTDQVVPFHDTLWVGIGGANDKLYLQSGQFTSTLKTSQSVTSIDTGVTGVSYDGTNTPWCGSQADQLYLQSGLFTSTLKTSELITSIDLTPIGISWDRTNTPWCGLSDDKLYLQSGQFTSTLKTSEYIGGVTADPYDISYDGTNTPWVGLTPDKLYLQSGQFTSTIKVSEDISSIDGVPSGISFDGNNTPWCGGEANKLYLQSGQFSSTLKTSEDVSGINDNLHGTDVTGLPFRLSA